MPLTDVAIRNVLPRERPFRLFDGGAMYLEVHPSGAKYWRLKYRWQGREKRLALGVYPKVGLKDARGRRDKAKQSLENGIDPGQARKTLKAARVVESAGTFRAIATEWIARNSQRWVPAHLARLQRRFETDVYPLIGDRPMAGLAATDLLAVGRRIEARGAHDTAHRALRECSQVFRYGVAIGRVDRDPSADLRGALAPVNRTSHFAAITDPRAIGPLLRKLHAYAGSPVVQAALQLAPLVFVRPGELRKAQWSEIDLRGQQWVIPSARMKMRQEHVVPLASQSVDILTRLQALTGEAMYVFPSSGSNERPMSDNTVLLALRRLSIGRDEMSGHGFRAMARTVLDEVLGLRVDIIEHQLAHKVRDPLGRAYNRAQFLEERRAMMQRWADYLDTLRMDKVTHDRPDAESRRTA